MNFRFPRSVTSIKFAEAILCRILAFTKPFVADLGMHMIKTAIAQVVLCFGHRVFYWIPNYLLGRIDNSLAHEF